MHLQVYKRRDTPPSSPVQTPRIMLQQSAPHGLTHRTHANGRHTRARHHHGRRTVDHQGIRRHERMHRVHAALHGPGVDGKAPLLHL